MRISMILTEDKVMDASTMMAALRLIKEMLYFRWETQPKRKMSTKKKKSTCTEFQTETVVKTRDLSFLPLS